MPYLSKLPLTPAQSTARPHRDAQHPATLPTTSMTRHPSHLSTHLRLLGMAVLWGASWPWGRIVAQAMPPLAASATRFLLACLILIPWAVYAGGWPALRSLPVKRKLGLGAAAATGVFGYAACFMFALQTVPASKASVVITLNPVVTLLFAVVLFHERLNRWIATGMAFAAAGALIVITHGDPLHILDTGMGRGELILLGCVACWVSYTLIGRVVMSGLDALTATAATSFVGALMLLAASLIFEGPAAWASLIHVRWSVWALLAMLAFASTALAYAWYFDGVKTLGAGAASGYITLVPVFGVLLSGLWLGESMDASLIAGGCIAIAGMFLMHLGRTMPSGIRLRRVD